MNANLGAATGLICLVAAALIWTVGQRHTPRLVVALVLAGTTGVAGSMFGDWVRTAVGWCSDMLGALTVPLVGVAVSFLVAGIALYVLVIHLWKKRIGYSTLACAAAVPLTVASIPGFIGSLAGNGVHAVAAGMGWIISAGLGIG